MAKPTSVVRWLLTLGAIEFKGKWTHSLRSPFLSSCTPVILVFGILQVCCEELHLLKGLLSGIGMSYVSILHWQEIVHSPNKPIAEEGSECKWKWDHQKQGSTQEVPCTKQSAYVCSYVLGIIPPPPLLPSFYFQSSPVPVRCTASNLPRALPEPHRQTVCCQQPPLLLWAIHGCSHNGQQLTAITTMSTSVCVATSCIIIIIIIINVLYCHPIKIVRPEVGCGHDYSLPALSSWQVKEDTWLVLALTAQCM